MRTSHRMSANKGKPVGFSQFETTLTNILFDTGYSDILLGNAEKMGIALEEISHIVLSHGHDDHTKGMLYLKDAMDLSAKQLIAHPDCFYSKYTPLFFVFYSNFLFRLV